MSTSGRANAEGFAAIDERILGDARHRPGMSVLFDHSDLDVAGFDPPRVRSVAERDREAYRTEGAFRYIAVVAPRPALFGLGRMWQAYVGDELEERSIIARSRAEAEAWLLERRREAV